MVLENNKPIMATIIPTYNNKELITEAMSSVLCQPEQSLLVVVIDDGSTDGTIEYLSVLQKQDKRLILIRQENQGVSVARNRGIAECIKLGVQYISFLDSDDVWCDDVWCDDVYNQELFNLLSKEIYEMNRRDDFDTVLIVVPEFNRISFQLNQDYEKNYFIILNV